MVSASAVVDLFTGSATVDTTPTVIMPYKDLTQHSIAWCMWVANDGPNPATVEFAGSPDGTNPDGETLTPYTIPVGQSAMLDRDTELRRYWSIMANATAGTANLRFGVTVLR